MTMRNRPILEDVRAEYNAVRDEIIFRLKAQQDIIKYTFAVAGLLAPIIGLILAPNIAKDKLHSILLIGPIICIFLKSIYLKHHIFIEILSSYISTKLSTNGRNCCFSGWEKYLTLSLYKNWRTSLFTGLLGLAEGEFSILIGILYLIVYKMLEQPNSPPNTFDEYLSYWFILDCIGLVIIVLVGFFVRKWVAKKRNFEHLQIMGNRKE